MRIYKGIDGIIFFLFTEIAIISQLICIIYTTDIDELKNNHLSQIEFSSYLPFHKICFYIITFLAIICHLKTSFTNPGVITHSNNYDILEFYYILYKEAMEQATEYTRIKGRKLIEEKITEIDDGIEELSENDEEEYKPETSITDEIMEKITKTCNLQLNRCFSCYVVRPNRAHHCSSCKGCVLGEDHHCPWVNNCIGLFNKKFFFLFNFYSFISALYSIFICALYSIYKNYGNILDNAYLIIVIIFQLFFGLTISIFCFLMLKDMFDGWDAESSYIDYKNKKILEKSCFSDEIKKSFGNEFGLNWFIPFKAGGYINIYNKIKKN